MIEWVPPAAIFIVGAFLIPAFKGRARQAYILLLPLIGALNLISMQPGVGWTYRYLGYELVFAYVDKWSLVFGYVFIIMAFIGMLYALGVKENGQHAAAFLYAGSGLGVIFSGDLLTLFIFWEIMAVSSVFLIWYQKEKKSISAGFRYLLFHTFGGLCLLAGIILRVVQTGSLEFGAIGLDGLDSYLILLGFLVNVAAVPLHTWLVDAYPEATITGTVFLSVFTTKTALYVLIRAYPGTEILMWLGAVMAVFGVMYAIIENDMRRILAYHMVSQLGYMVAAVGIGTPMALNGSISHAFAYIIYKGLLFMSTGAIIFVVGRRKLTELGGLYRTMPITLILYAVGGFAISGVPLLSGFVSKTMVIASAEAAHQEIIFLMLVMASVGTFLSVGIKLPYFAFFAKDSGIRAREPPLHMLAAMGLAAFLCILIGVYPNVLYQLLPNPVDYLPYTLPHVIGELQLLMFTALGFFLLLKKLKVEPYIILDFDWLYRKAGGIFLRFINGPLARGSAWTVEVCLRIISMLKWFAKNPVLASIIIRDTLVMEISESTGYRGIVSRKALELEKQLYPKNPVKRNPVGDSLLLALIFMSVYVMYYMLTL